MSTASAKPKKQQKPESVEELIEQIRAMPVKNIRVIKNVWDGLVSGAVELPNGEWEGHELELAAGVTYILIGVGKMPSHCDDGIGFIE